MAELACVVERVLRAAMKLGDTIIVTNAKGGWVHESARAWMKPLVPTLEELTVVSAREHFEQAYPGDTYQWKRAAFEYILEGRCEERPNGSHEGVNLIALGDSHAEIEAAQYAANSIGETAACIKTVKFKERPSVPELLGELERTALELEGLVHARRSMDIVLDDVSMPSPFSLLTRLASGWKFSECKWHSSVCMDDDNIALFALDIIPPWMIEIGKTLSHAF